MGTPSILSLTRKAAALVRDRPTLFLICEVNRRRWVIIVVISIRTTSETVVGDEEIQNQKYRVHRDRRIDSQVNVLTMPTPSFTHYFIMNQESER
jgi:hypothetical protein